jgi:peptide/nickel transport system substrate-binding protein
VNTTRRSKLAAIALGLSLVAAACGSDDDSSGDTTATTTAVSTADTAATETTAGTDTTAATDTTGDTAGEPSGEAAMRVTYDINPDAVWDDGTPIGMADFQCTLDATMNTPGSLSQEGYRNIVSITEGATAQEIVVDFDVVYAPYKNVFNPIIKADYFDDCNDISADLLDTVPFSGREWKQESWSLDQTVLVPNEAYWGPEKPIAERVVMVPQADSDTEILSLTSGAVDFIFPQAFSGITEALADPSIKYTPGYGTNYEGLYFQQYDGPFADDAFRQGFAHSIDRELILSTIYDPIFPGAPLLQCGLWVPTIGPWCDDTVFTDFFDPAVAEKALTDGGWAKNASGMWEKDGTVPELRWVVNAGNSRRESTQALMIPELAKMGFNVIADNCDAACFFQQRLPALDYDLAMYINTASPDPTVTSIMACDSIPTEENGNVGQNSSGWCNEEASDLMAQADSELDIDKRTELVHQIAALVGEDAVMVSLFQFPNIAAWKTDALSGPIDKDAANYTAFQNMWEWDPGADGEILIGAEQWPECLNPITECANSSWMVWTSTFKLLPGAFDTTGEGEYVPSALLAGDPVVEVL